MAAPDFHRFCWWAEAEERSPRTAYKNQPAWDNYKRKAWFSRPKKTPKFDNALLPIILD